MTLNTFLRFRENMSRSLRQVTTSLENVIRRTEQATARLRALARLSVQPLIALRDRVTRVLQRVGARLLALGRSVFRPLLIVRDYATRIVTRVGLRLHALRATIFRIPLAIRDLATRAITRIRHSLWVLSLYRFMIPVGVRNLASRVIARVTLQLNRFRFIVAVATLIVRNRATPIINRAIIQLRRFGQMVVRATIQARDFATKVAKGAWNLLKSIGSFTAWAAIRARDFATRVAKGAWDILKKVGNFTAWAAIKVRDLATTTIKAIGRGLARIGSFVGSATIKIIDKATPVIKSITAQLKKLGGLVSKVGGTLGLSGGALLTQGGSAAHTDALIGAQTRLTGSEVTNLVDQNYYNGVGDSREAVTQIVQRIAQQSDLQGEALKDAVRIASELQTLNPEASVQELVRPLTAQLNAQNVAFKRTADALTYLQRAAGDQYDDAFDTFTEYATTAAKNKISPERLVSGLIRAQKQGGWNYDTGADALREWGIRTVTAIDKNAVDALAMTLGKARTKELYTQLKNGQIDAFGFLTEVVNGLEKIKNPIKKNQAQIALYGTMFEDNDKAISEFFKGLMTTTDTTDALSKAYKELKNNDPSTEMTKTWLQFKNATKNLGIDIIKALAPTFKEFNAWASSEEGKKKIKEFTESIKEFSVTVGKDLVSGLKWIVTHWDDIEHIIKGEGKDGKVYAPGPLTALAEDIHHVGEAAKEATKTLRLANDILSILKATTDGFSMSGIVNWVDQATQRFIPFYDMIRLAIDGLTALMNKGAEAQQSFTDTEVAVRRMGNAVLQNTPVVSTLENNLPQKTFTDTLKQNNPALYQNMGIPTKTAPKFSKGLKEVKVDELNANIHRGEMVVPAQEAQMIRDMAAGKSINRQSSTSAATDTGITVYHYGDIYNGEDTKAMYAGLRRELRREMDISTKGGPAYG